MAFDKDQLFNDGSTAITDGNSSALQVGPGEYDISAVTQALVAGDTLDIDVYDSADNSTYVKIGNFEQITAKGVKHVKVVTQREYLRLTYNKTNANGDLKAVIGLTRGHDGVKALTA